MHDFEKLGSFYLGRVFDPATRKRGDGLVLYDSKDLVTHAVCVGMTGSGKTGLCIGLLEEAAIDGIPAIVIDPKGDLADLLLTFPDLRAEDFAPWVNHDDARRKGVPPAEFAAQQAELWRKGLAEWGQDGARIRKLKDAADFAVYTPGSGAGLGVSVLRSFTAPAGAIVEDTELFRERIGSTVTGLLGLMGVEADPLQSREHILLSTIFENAWAAGQDLDLPTLIQRIQQPPVQRIGVMELETFYPSKDRFALAMQLNSLIASPGFSRWLEGEPLDIGAMLYTPEGKPRVSIFSIAHLNDAERMFFVSLLLNQMLGWVRMQSGTTSLRALLYMDEIAGYFPPVANPPSKRPLLMLMKQARAFGVGVVLATQNPVDLDYKGLANAGTWFIGRLQTDRDKQRVLDGLEGASASAAARFDRASVDTMLSQLGTRVFLMNNVHEDAPEVFETRWVLSYLRGPLTREQIRALMDARRGAGAATAVTAAAAAAASARPASTEGPLTGNGGNGSHKPVLPPEIQQYFIAARATGKLEYRPMLLGSAKVYYQDAKAGVDEEDPACYLCPIAGGPVSVDWDAAEETALSETDLEGDPAPEAAFMPLPAEAGKPRSYEAWKKSFGDMVFRNHGLELLRSPGFKAVSRRGESERDFRLRLQQLAREQRDAIAEKLRAKYAPKVAALQDRIRRARQQVEVQKSQATSAKLSTALSFGAAILGAFTGRKIASAGNISKATSAARGASRSAKESGDVGRAEENVDALQRQLAELEQQFNDEINALADKLDPMSEELETLSLKPKKANISVRAVVLAWAPYSVDAAGKPVPAWR